GKKNILPNGSFEIGEFNASNIPNGWVLMENEQKANIVWDDKEFIDGTKSLKIYPSKTKVLLISNSFPIFSDDVYFTKCSIKSDIIDNDKFIVRFLTFDKNGNKKESNKIKKRPTKDWKTYHFSSSFFSKNTKFARIIIEIPASTTKTYWIDDVGTFDVYKFK
ncbi:MAG: hypothetical protein U9N34_06875, partial [Candidatus Cloacimonadota bacterium]|nr:hypothetical protein [Candidatus Cloacimonadota bacterium]